MTMDEPFLLLDLLKILTTSKGGMQHDAGNSEDTLGWMLENQLKLTQEKIITDSKYEKLCSELQPFCSGPADIYWRFAGILLKILVLYKQKVTELTPVFEQKVKNMEKLKRTEDTAPPMSPDTLGSSHIQIVVASLQFIACLGICPALLPGAGVPVNKRSQMMGKVAQPQSSLLREVRDRRLTHCVAVFLECLKLQTTLKSLVLSHHTGDILAMLIQLSYAPLPRPKVLPNQNSTTSQNSGKSDSTSCAGEPNLPSEEAELQRLEELYLEWKPEADEPLTLNDRKWARRQLQSFTKELSIQVLVREVLILQGGRPEDTGSAKKSPLVPAPPWLRKYCGFLLSECLIRPQGVLNVLRALLEDQSDFKVGQKATSVDWKRCEAVARVIANCPQQIESPALYYGPVGAQVLELLRLKNEVVAKQLVKVATAAITAMMEIQPQVAMETVMKPLMQTLLALTSNSELKKPPGTDVIWEEKQLTNCLEDLHKVFVTGSAPNSTLLSHLSLILGPLFGIYVFASSGVFALRSHCEDILCAYLKQASVKDAKDGLCHLIFTRNLEDGNNVSSIHPCVSFSAGPTGGVVAVYKEQRADDLENDVETVAKSASQILLKLKRPELTAELFLLLLKRLGGIVKEEIDPQENCGLDSKKSENGREMLEINTGLENMKDNLMVLSLIAHMTDQLGPDCFTKTQHIVDFVQVTLERAVTVLKNTEDEMFGAFENETVTMAMGMLTAVMGGAKQLTTEEKTHLKILLPLLQELSEQHPDTSIQEMSSDLRIAIATHGLILSDGLKSTNQKTESKSHDIASTNQKTRASANPKRASASSSVTSANQMGESLSHDIELTNQKRESVPNHRSSKNEKRKPLIEVISSTDNSEPIHKPETKPNRTDTDTKNSQNVGEKPSECAINVPKKDNLMKNQLAKDKSDSQESNNEGDMSQYKEAINCLLDPLLPVRGHGLIMLSNLLHTRDPETMKNSEMLLKIFRENIHHEDSYLYLAAINGLSALATHAPDEVLPVLAKSYCEKVGEVSGKDVSVKKERNIEWRLKLGETLVKTCKALGEFVPSYRDMLVSSCLTVAKDEEPLVRASAVSNLGDICKLLRFSLGNIIFQVLDCISSLLRTDPDAEVRKSAAMFTTLLLQGLGNDAMKVLEEALRDLYRLLKITLTTEREEMVRVHVQLSLNELDSIMREYLFPKQTLTKHIYVADAPPN